jgi:P27 family predicted phage terminase small subunit
VLLGNPSKKKLNLREPRPPAGAVLPPKELSAAARALWQELAPKAIEMGVLTTVDVRAFGALCELQATFNEISAQKAVDGYKAVTWAEDEFGVDVLKISPILRLERDTAAALKWYYAMFGLEPSSRSKLVVGSLASTPAAAVSKWA